MKIVLTTIPAVMRRKKIDPKTITTPSRQFSTSQLTLRVTVAATRQIPSTVKKMAFRRRPEIMRFRIPEWPGLSYLRQV